MPFYFKSTKYTRHKVNPTDLFYSRAAKEKAIRAGTFFSGLSDQCNNLCHIKPATISPTVACFLLEGAPHLNVQLDCKLNLTIAIKIIFLHALELNFSCRHSQLQLTSDFTCIYICEGKIFFLTFTTIPDSWDCSGSRVKI